ncbi:MAG TPA: hypothetical protein VGM27_28470 [Acidobacteriaceae bacterium]|jgi:hypothetical protein
MTYGWIIVLRITGLLITGSASAQGNKVYRTELPPAVERTLQSVSQGAAVKHLSQEDQDGQIYYKAEMRVDGHSKDVLINTTGDIERVGEQIAFDRLPADMKAKLKAKAKFLGRIAKVEAITRKDQLVVYEARTEKPIPVPGGVFMKRSKVQIDPDGNPLDHTTEIQREALARAIASHSGGEISHQQAYDSLDPSEGHLKGGNYNFEATHGLGPNSLDCGGDTRCNGIHFSAKNANGNWFVHLDTSNPFTGPVAFFEHGFVDLFLGNTAYTVIPRPWP